MMPMFTFNLVKTVLEESPNLSEFMSRNDEKFDVCLIEVFNVDAFLVRLENVQLENGKYFFYVTRELLKNMIAF